MGSLEALERRLAELERRLVDLCTIGPIAGKSPRIHPTAFIARGAHIYGDVTVEEEASVWFGSVARGDVDRVVVLRQVHVEDNCVLHSGTALEIGPYVVLGHGVIAHCRRIGPHCLIGNGAIILDGAEIPDYCIVAAGSVVTGDLKAPPSSLIAGAPAVVKGALASRQLELIEMYQRSYDAAARRYRDAGYGQAIGQPAGHALEVNL